MEKRFSGFLIAIMLMASKFFNCQALLESPVKKKNVLNIRLKEQCQDLVKDSETEGILKVRKELKKNLEDLRLDMMRRDVELYEEIYHVKENLTGNDTAKEKQTTSLDDGERTVWLKKFEYLEAGIKEASQESMNNADTLQENLERLDRENRKISSRMDTMEITLMKVVSQSSVNLNDSEGLIFTTYLQKLEHVDDRLNDINETMQDVCNSTTDMQTMGTFQSEVMTLKSYVDVLSGHVNSTLDDKTRAIEDLADLSENIQLNMTKVLNENEQYFSKELLKLMRIVSEVSNLSNSNLNFLQDLSSQEKQFEIQVNHSKQDLKNEMTVLKNQLNITVTNFEEMKDKQVEISNDLMNINLRMYSISDAWNATNEELGILNNSFSEKLTDFKTQVQLVVKENSIQSEQLTKITTSVNDLRRKLHDHYNVHVRLVGGTYAGEGRVEVYYSNAWGTICDDDWDNSDARVVCRMLGYSGSYTAYGSAHYGAGTGQIWLDDVGCSGTESSITSCIHPEWGVHNCRHHEDASVKCT